MFGPERWKKQGNGGNNIMRSFMICTPREILRDEVKRWARHVASVGREEVHTGFWWGNLKARDHLEGL